MRFAIKTRPEPPTWKKIHERVDQARRVGLFVGVELE